MFKEMKLGIKLIISFLAVAMLALIIGIVGVIGISNVNSYAHKIYNKDLLGISYVKAAKINRLEVARSWRSLLLNPHDNEAQKRFHDTSTEEYIEIAKYHIDSFKTNIQKGSEFFDDEKSRKILKEINEQAPEWERLTLQMMDLAIEKNLGQRTIEFDELFEKQIPKGKIIDAKIDELAALAEENAAQTAYESETMYNNCIAAMVIFILFGFVVSLLIGLFFSRYLTAQLGGELKEAIEQVRSVSAGNFDRQIVLKSRDNSSLLYALKQMQDTLNAFCQAQRFMTQKHQAGFISEKIAEEQFNGTYREMAREVNDVVQSHIDVNKQVVAVVTEYGKGNFDVSIERLPNEKAGITASIDSVKSALLAINKEIEGLASAAAQGDFSKRSDTSRFDFMFKEMLVYLNTLVETCDVAFGDVLCVSEALAKGDLTQTVSASYPGMFGKVMIGMNSTVDNLQGLLGEIQEASNIINGAAKEIATGNNDLSQRTEKQAANLQQTAASMQELTTTVQTNSESAKYANEMALVSSDIAKRGVDVVDQVVDTMVDINESSRKVVDIITVIDSIAFQTNILALNAAVEAARAGEQGRGFAVVAGEVRNLAQRAAAAAGEIKELIGNSVEKVEDGTKLVERAGQTMKEIVSSIQSVTQTIVKIADASSEQTYGIQQINETIREMDDVTQQNAALVEQAASAAEALETQAQTLAKTVSVFKTDNAKILPIMSDNTDRKMFPMTSVKKSVRQSSPKYESSPVMSDDWEEF